MRTRLQTKSQTKILLLGVLTMLTMMIPPVSAFAIGLPEGFADELVADSFDTPVALAPLPDGRIVILEQYNGGVYLTGADSPSVRTLIHTVEDVNVSGGNERGLLGVALDPAFENNGYFYIYYTAKGNQCKVSRLTISKILDRADSIAPESRLEILTDIPDNAWNHNGGTLRFGPDSMLYVSIGDDASSCIAQSITDLRGSILRLDVRLSNKEVAKLKTGDISVLTPADNPYAEYLNDKTKLIYVSGLRNPFRFDIDPLAGDMLIADVGLLDFEEIDYAPKATGGGENFGWPFYEGPAPRAQPGCRKDSKAEYIQPVAFYDRTGFVASVISLCVYRPSVINGKYTWPSEYFGDYLYTDYFAGFIRRLKPDADRNWNTPTKVAGQADSLNWAVDFKSVPDAFVGTDGALYYLRQFNDSFSPKTGQLRRIIYQKAARTK